MFNQFAAYFAAKFKKVYGFACLAKAVKQEFGENQMTVLFYGIFRAGNSYRIRNILCYIIDKLILKPQDGYFDPF